MPANVLITPQTVPSRSEKRRAAHGNRQQNQAGFQLQRFLRDDIFHRALDVLHVFERDLLLARVAAGPAQARIQLHAAGLVDHVKRAAFDVQPAVKHIQHFFCE
jgi:hypothetical protein